MSELTAHADAYGYLDRLLHRVAFAHPRLQRLLGEIEDDLFKRSLANVRVERPVFVTGLPRAGTTLLLELLYGSGELASFTYRQMPFVLNPLLWHRLSARAQRAGHARERAHGDAVLIDHDSPEAFEEVLWLNHLADTLFVDGGMRPLDARALGAEFRRAYRRLAEKLVCLAATRTGEAAAPPPRYLSKNNANLARLPAIASVFGDATFLVCFRDPAAHVASLHAQHLRFLAMHDEDPFAARYMAWIGHHDFGRNFRPILFDAPIETPPTEPLFWLRYWIDAYRHALAHAPPRTRFVRFETLLEDGADELGRLAGVCGLGERGSAALLAGASRLRSPGSVAAPLARLSPDLAAEAEGLYGVLRARSEGG